MNKRRLTRGGAALGVVLGLVVGLSVLDPVAADPSFDGWGRVTAVDPSRSTVTIEHAGIQGLLPGGRSEFPVQAPAVLQDARPGDHVRFTLGTGDESHGLLTLMTLTPETPSVAGSPDRLLVSVAVALGLLTLAAAMGVGIVLWRELQVLHRRVVALDHEAASLRSMVGETKDEVHQIARALEEAATALRVGYVQEIRRRLVPRSSASTTEAPGAKSPGNPSSTLVIVQRGRGELYRAVECGAAGPGLTVIWDRRRSDRRRNVRRVVDHERRRTERRSAAPEIWTGLGFQIVPQGPADVARTARVLGASRRERGTPG